VEFTEQLQWKVKIQQWAAGLGFVSIGFTTAEPIAALAPMLQARIAQGLMTSFENQDIQQRINPCAVWPLCQTVVALAYPLPLSVPPQDGEGVLARSAVGEDYHQLVSRKLKELTDTMIRNDWPGNFSYQVDTGPLIERAFAVRAGIGWIGRNQHLIIPGYGSFVVLALLLLDQAITADVPLKAEQCGGCHQCLDACPAQIIGHEPFPATRCISYLTQSKQVLTLKECVQLGKQIFGCDTCQEVCPQNLERIKEEKAYSSQLRRGANLLESLNLTKGEFLQRFKSTAAGWRGKGILQRNAFLVMRNLQDERCLQWLADRQKLDAIPPSLIPYISPKQD